jgi:flotillin
MSSIMLIGGIVAGVIVLFASILGFISKNYIKIAPNMAAVVFGRNHKHKVKQADGSVIDADKGFKLLTGGGFLKIPIIESVQMMDLSNRQIAIKVTGAPNKDGVMTTIEGIANVKFAAAKELLVLAVERFLGKPNDEIDNIIFQNLEGHLRSVVGQMTMEDLIRDKQALNEKILSDANEDFEKMGIKIDFLNISDIKDDVEYIINMGRKRASEIKRDADIGTADAERDAQIKTTLAERLGVEAANENQVAIIESDRTRDVKKAEMRAEVDAKKATADQAGPKANAIALKGVVVEEAATEAAQEKALVEVEAARALKEEKRYLAEKIVPAEAEKTAKIIQANATKESVIITAEGTKSAAIKTAEGEAEAVKVNAFALAEGDAAKIREKGLAEASAIKAKLLAEAEGVTEKAKAYALLDQTGKFLEVLNALQTLGPNMVKEFAGVMSASTAHLANVDEIKIVDFGGDGAGGSAVGKLGNVPNEVMTKLLAGADATGFDVSKLLNWAGFSSEETAASVDAPEEIKPTGDAPKA